LNPNGYKPNTSQRKHEQQFDGNDVHRIFAHVMNIDVFNNMLLGTMSIKDSFMFSMLTYKYNSQNLDTLMSAGQNCLAMQMFISIRRAFPHPITPLVAPQEDAILQR